MVHKSPASKKIRTRKNKQKSNIEAGLKVEFGGEHVRKRYMGVRQSPSGRWVAEIKATAQKIRLWLGTFDTAEQAARAYDEAACLLRGANTRTNFWFRPGGPQPTPSVLPAKVVNHILGHFESQRAAEARPLLPPSTPLGQQPASLSRAQLQMQSKEQLEIEPITRMAFSDKLFSEVSASSSSAHSGEENEFSITYCNSGVRFQDGKEEVNMDLRTLEEELSCFYTPFEMAVIMEDERNKTQVEAYDYWLRLSTEAKIF